MQDEYSSARAEVAHTARDSLLNGCDSGATEVLFRELGGGGVLPENETPTASLGVSILFWISIKEM